MRWLPKFAAAIAMTMVAAAAVRADEIADLRQNLDALKARIEQIDGDLTETGKNIGDMNAETAAYRGKLAEADATGAKLNERSRQLTAHKGQLDAEHEAAAQLCRKTVSEAEYKATVAHCQVAADTYQQHADAYRADEQSLAADYAAYQAEARELKARYDDIEQKRRTVQARQDSLQSARREAADRFNAERERLIALQSKQK